MDNILDTALLAFTTMFTMVNPLGIMPVYTSITADLSTEQARKTAAKAVIIATITIVLFALTGELIFNFFQISVNSLKVVGGVIFFMVGYDMLQARIVRTKTSDAEQDDAQFASDIAITPLAIPLLCGPGAITGSIVIWKDAASMPEKMVFLLAVVIVMILTLVILVSSRQIIRFLGDSGNKVLMRIMGLIVMVIAIEFFFTGVGKFLRDTFQIAG